MKEFLGKSICKGIAIGRILFFTKEKSIVIRKTVEDRQAEIYRFNEARACAKREFSELSKKALNSAGDANAMIFEAYEAILDDEMFSGNVTKLILEEGVNAEYAVMITGQELTDKFEQLEDDYFRERAADVKDIADRVISILCKAVNENLELREASIVVATELAPADTISMNKNKLLSIVTEQGSSLSHTAILARSMNIPALSGVEVDASWNGKLAIVDGNSGSLILDPDSATLDKYTELLGHEQEKYKMAEELKVKESITKDGKSIMLCANIESPEEAKYALENGASGIGLFRSEFVFLNRTDFPTEDEQFEVYKSVVSAMGGRSVVFRTLDIGADKQADYFDLEPEANPALGYRAIRICLDRTDIFKTQLRALYRASAYGKVSIMFPMIISLEEVLEIKDVCNEVKAGLENEGIEFGDVELGIMIETPAAVMISDILAKEVDFFSIGTNDLTQYTLATDRQNSKLDKYYNPHHEALLRMIKLVTDNAHAAGCRVGICGELGADTALTERFIHMGIDELSVSPSFLLSVKKAVRESVS